MSLLSQFSLTLLFIGPHQSTDRLRMTPVSFAKTTESHEVCRSIVGGLPIGSPSGLYIYQKGDQTGGPNYRIGPGIIYTKLCPSSVRYQYSRSYTDHHPCCSLLTTEACGRNTALNTRCSQTHPTTILDECWIIYYHFLALLSPSKIIEIFPSHWYYHKLNKSATCIWYTEQLMVVVVMFAIYLGSFSFALWMHLFICKAMHLLLFTWNRT